MVRDSYRATSNLIFSELRSIRLTNRYHNSLIFHFLKLSVLLSKDDPVSKTLRESYARAIYDLSLIQGFTNTPWVIFDKSSVNHYLYFSIVDYARSNTSISEHCEIIFWYFILNFDMRVDWVIVSCDCLIYS